MNRVWQKLLKLIQRDKTRRPTSHVHKILDDKNHQGLASLTLAQYVDLIAEVPLPTAQQRENFVEYVSHAHSWYKHLPLNLPGAPFYFFVDRYAGMDRVIMKDGTQAFTERKGIPLFGHSHGGVSDSLRLPCI